MQDRASGILCHITCLPCRFGIGDLGPSAYSFVDFLAQAKQGYWQILPLNPIEPSTDNSPYNSISAFAANTLLISPELLMQEGLLKQEDLRLIPDFSHHYCDFRRVIPYKEKIFEHAFENFKKIGKDKIKFSQFSKGNSFWLEDFVLFKIIRRNFNGNVWSNWGRELRDRQAGALKSIKINLAYEIEKEKFLQYLFFKQWFSLKEYCNKKNIKLIGDIPLYVSYDSVEVWTHRDIFKLASDKKPAFLSGVPPDYFSRRGQLWGNPVYNWEVLKKNGFNWWIERLRHNLKLFDLVRLDHFPGLIAYWQVPAGEEDAVKGEWINVPHRDLFKIIAKYFSFDSIIAEDLGVVTKAVKRVMHNYGIRGMKVLLFAFDNDDPRHPYLPDNYDQGCIVYTGTHDNNTVIGWFMHEASPKAKRRLFDYLGKKVRIKEVNWDFIKLAMASRAKISIFPLQDLLGLGQEARMNVPSTVRGNWRWRFEAKQLNLPLAREISEMALKFRRAK